MAIKTGQATLNGLKYNLDDRDRVAAQTYVESNTGLSAGTGFDGTETYVSWVEQFGGIIKTSILVDLTGLYSDAAGDIIGENGGTANCNLGQVTTAKCGTIVAGRMTCLETPDGGEPDIDVYSADEATGAENAAVTGLTETALLNVGQDWIAGAFESDRDQQQHAQGLADTYKFEINKQLKEQEEADKISTAVGNTLGVYSGYFT